jgi:4-amino-4-deoxy-L-arabinose transferase-like glycosyltransferase
MPSDFSSEEKSARRAAFLWLAALTILRLVFVAFVGLGDAEAYYWTWSRHLDLSYYDHPPMVAYLIAATTALGGDHPFFVRLGPVLLFAATSALVYALATDVSGRRRVGLAALLLFQLTPAFAIGGQGANPDVPLGFFWLLCAWCLWRATTFDRPHLLWLAGAALGAAFLSKYFALLLAVSGGVWLLRRSERRFWRSGALYGGMLLAAAFVIPVVFWNVDHDWPSVRYHFSRHSAAGVSLEQIGKFWGGQALYYSPLLFGAYLWALWLALRHLFRARRAEIVALSATSTFIDMNDPHRLRERAFAFLVILSLPSLVFFTFIGMWTPEAEPHWTAMGYVPLVVLAAMAFDERWPSRAAPARRFHEGVVQGPSRRFRWFVYAAAGLPALLLVLAHVHLLTSVFVPLVPERDRPRDLVAETSGWREVGAHALAIARTLREPLLLHYHYTKCAQLSFAVGPRARVACLNDRIDQFDFWQDERALIGRDMLYVTDSVYSRTPESVWRFDRCTEEAPLEVRRGGHLLRRFRFWRCEGYRGPQPNRKDL